MRTGSAIPRISATSVPASATAVPRQTAPAVYERHAGASAGRYHANYEAHLYLSEAPLAANRWDLDETRAELEIFWSLADF